MKTQHETRGARCAARVAVASVMLALLIGGAEAYVASEQYPVGPAVPAQIDLTQSGFPNVNRWQADSPAQQLASWRDYAGPWTIAQRPSLRRHRQARPVARSHVAGPRARRCHITGPSKLVGQRTGIRCLSVRGRLESVGPGLRLLATWVCSSRRLRRPSRRTIRVVVGIHERRQMHIVAPGGSSRSRHRAACLCHPRPRRRSTDPAGMYGGR